MKIDFVSLHELVQSVARDVPVEEQVLNPSLNPGKPLNVDDEFLKQAALRQIEHFYKESRAAAKLGNYLAVAPRDICPRWFAPGPTGDYWATEQAREEGLGTVVLRNRCWGWRLNWMQPSSACVRMAGVACCRVRTLSNRPCGTS